MENQSNSENQNNGHTEETQSNVTIRFCRFCLTLNVYGQETIAVDDWIKPCKCTEFVGWVHKTCLQRWVDEKQQENPYRSLKCLLCETEYIIIFPNMGFLADVLEFFNSLIDPILYPSLTFAVLCLPLYLVSLLYGIFIVYEILGSEALTEVLKSNPIITLVGVPAIPICFALSRMICWEDYILRYLENRYRNIYQVSRRMLQIPDYVGDHQADNNQVAARYPPRYNMLNTIEWLCVGFLQPLVSSMIGRVFFSYITNTLYRTLFGGLTFISVKGVFKIYLKYKQFINKQQRTVLNYTDRDMDENILRYQHYID